ncbi:MAG: linear amide C-N hydrolase [Cyanobacteriota bacterium]|nr:linear amide C-N hydrolase [Cyanobacteriota bacterium]
MAISLCALHLRRPCWRTAVVLGLSLLANTTTLAPAGVACTRVLFTAPDGTVITGRSMDWSEDMRSNLWAFPRGMERNGAGGTHTPRWRSRYGSVVVSGYDLGTAEGMNEQGLVANLLYLGESDYGTPDGKPVLSISLWAQYVLDQFASVEEAVSHLRKEPFRIVAPILPNGQGAQLHLSLSDASGDSAILEYIKGRLVIHHGKQYTVMTNSPSFDQQLALNSYWQSIGGAAFLPGTIRAADRFARASYLLKALPRRLDPAYSDGVPKHSFTHQALASVLSLVRGVSVPLGITTPGQPNIASTIWRAVSDQRRRVLLFDSVSSPSVFWVSLDQVNLSPGAPVRKLQVAGGRVHAGETAAKFEASPPFAFLPASGLSGTKTIPDGR